MGAPAWKSLPTGSWSPAVRGDPARRRAPVRKRMGATTVEVPSNHCAMVSHPDEVVEVIGALPKPWRSLPQPSRSETSRTDNNGGSRTLRQRGLVEGAVAIRCRPVTATHSRPGKSGQAPWSTARLPLAPRAGKPTSRPVDAHSPALDASATAEQALPRGKGKATLRSRCLPHRSNLDSARSSPVHQRGGHGKRGDSPPRGGGRTPDYVPSPAD